MIQQQVDLLKTIADATRLRILGLLAAGPRTGRELAEQLELSAPTISHHMKRLESVGIVTVTPDANRRVYRLDGGLLGELRGEAAAASVEDPFQAKVRRTFFDGQRLVSIPAKRRARVAVLLELLRRFEPGRVYAEPEVNELLRQAHPDVAFLRRELVNYRYLTREGGRYWVTDEVPHRDANERQEVPAGEAEWLRGLIRSAARAANS